LDSPGTVKNVRLAAAHQQKNISAQLQSTCGCCGHLDSPGPVNARLVADLQKKQPFSLACFSQLVDVCQRIIPKEITYLIIEKRHSQKVHDIVWAKEILQVAIKIH